MKPDRSHSEEKPEPDSPALDCAAMEASRVRRRQARALRAPLYVLVPLVVWLAWPAGVVPRPVADEPGAHATRLEHRLDPNTAEWWELTSLPRIGETLAQRIVAYREEQAAENGAHPVFGCAGDLENISGIGPKTVARIAAHLSLPADCTKPGSPPPVETPPPTPPDR